MHLSAIAIDRYLSVMHPLRYKIVAAEVNMTKVMAAVWALTALIMLPGLLGQLHVLPASVHQCGIPHVSPQENVKSLCWLYRLARPTPIPSVAVGFRRTSMLIQKLNATVQQYHTYLYRSE